MIPQNLDFAPGLDSYQAEILGEMQEVLNLRKAPKRDIEESAKLSAATLGITLGDIGGHGNRGPTKLDR